MNPKRIPNTEPAKIITHPRYVFASYGNINLKVRKYIAESIDEKPIRYIENLMNLIPRKP